MDGKAFPHLLYILAITLPLAAQPCWGHEEYKAEDPPDLIEAVTYRNPAERREAGLGRSIGANAKIFGLLEYEALHISHPDGNPSDTDQNEETFTGQLALEWNLTSNVKMELVGEIEKDQRTQSRLDEGMLEVDLDWIEITFGRLYAPFGEYYSYFFSGPMIEFGETSGGGVIIDFDLTDTIEMQLYGMRNMIREPDTSSRQSQWGANLNHSNDAETFQIAVGFISDLRAADDSPIADYASEDGLSRVGGINTSVLWQLGITQLTFEYITTVKHLSLEGERRRPGAYSAEATIFATDHLQFSARYERAFSLPDSARQQFGLSASYSPFPFLILTVEYLKGGYPLRLLDNDEDEESQFEAPVFPEESASEFYPPDTSSFGFNIAVEF